MTHRAVKLISRLSMGLLAVSGVLLVCSLALSCSDHFLSFNNSFHVGLQSQRLDARLVFFNSADYGPYRGSLVGIRDVDGRIYPPLEHQSGFGDSWGIYYRDFQWSNSRLWTLALSLWYPIILFAIAPLGVLSHNLLHNWGVSRA